MKKLLTICFVAAGVLLGILVAKFGWWDIIEPITGMATLALAGGAMFNSWLTGRKLEASVQQRRFEMTFLLRDGYQSGAKEFTKQNAEKAYAEWMQKRCDAEQKFVTGLMDTCTVTFPLGGKNVVQAPGVMLSGSLSPLYDKDRPDFEVVETLKSLAGFIARRLNQPRVYFSFNGVQYTVNTEEEMIRKHLGNLASGEVVYEEDDSHLSDHPSVVPLVGEILTQITSNNRQSIVDEVDLGREVGKNIRVQTTDEDEIIFARRPGRTGLTRFVKNRQSEPCSKVVVILIRQDSGEYVISTAFIGMKCPAEPWDEKWADENSVPFWNSQALVWGSEKIVPGTETTISPW